jgi:hypothetical protein
VFDKLYLLHGRREPQKDKGSNRGRNPIPETQHLMARGNVVLCRALGPLWGRGSKF